MASHDPALIAHCDTLWDLDEGAIKVFTGSHDDYCATKHQKREAITHEIDHLQRCQDAMHHKRMREQQRAAASRAKGQKSIAQRKWPTVVSTAKATRAEETSGRKTAALMQRKEELADAMRALKLPPVITPRFVIPSDVDVSGLVVNVTDGAVGYASGGTIISGLSLSLAYGERLAIVGHNGSGKSTVVKAILDDPDVKKTGDWWVRGRIGYLDQHYRDLSPDLSVLESLAARMPSWPHAMLRQHLQAFLFCANSEVGVHVKNLSGGEKARLSLACMAAQTPHVLVLDEMTNNLDHETRNHVTQVLKAFPGALLVISHDDRFLGDIAVHSRLVLPECLRLNTQ